MDHKTTNTPETDAAWNAYQMDSTCNAGDPWGLASRLERERNEFISFINREMKMDASDFRIKELKRRMDFISEQSSIGDNGIAQQ